MKLYKAVVEDNKDPLESSRVRVRVFGVHTEKNEHSGVPFNFISSTDLPWSEVVGGTSFGLVGGIGISNILQQGTWVWVFFENDNPNKPVVIGTVCGQNKTRTAYTGGEGFNDVDEVYPFSARADETDINRLSTGKNLNNSYRDTPTSVYNTSDTIHKQINDNVDVVSVTDTTSGADVSQTEPNSTSDLTTYPNSSVLETPSGHVIEYDDTPSNERIRLFHTSGSYIEMKPDGTIIQKSVDNGTNSASQYIHMNDVNEHIAKSVKRYIEQNVDEIIDGAVKRKIGATLDEHIVGDVNLTVDGNLTWNVTGSISIVGSDTIGVTSSKAMTLGSSTTLGLTSTKAMTLGSSTTLGLTSTTDMTLTSSKTLGLTSTTAMTLGSSTTLGLTSTNDTTLTAAIINLN